MEILKNIRDAFLGTPGRVQGTVVLCLIIFAACNPGVIQNTLGGLIHEVIHAIVPFTESIFVLMVMLFGCKMIYNAVFGGGGGGKKK